MPPGVAPIRVHNTIPRSMNGIPVPKVARSRASNPCSEYMFLDNTACNLASVNLRRFFDESTNNFDVEGFEYTCRLWTTVLEISVLMAQFPSKEVAQFSMTTELLVLGYANLGSMLMVMGIAYDSEEARGIAGAITAIMTGISYKTSAEMAGDPRTISTVRRK